MKFSENTIQILKNFSTINQSMLFSKGNVLKTISPQKTIFARAEIAEYIETDFAIYELPRFLGALSLFTDPEVELQSDRAIISAGKRRVVYTYADPSTFVTPPSKEISLNNPEVVFNLSFDELQKVQRAGNLFNLPEIAVTGDGEQLILSACNIDNPTSDTYKVVVDQSDYVFNAVFRNENLKFMSGEDYEVSISSKGISSFESNTLKYWIAVERSSSFS